VSGEAKIRQEGSMVRWWARKMRPVPDIGDFRNRLLSVRRENTVFVLGLVPMPPHYSLGVNLSVGINPIRRIVISEYRS
jgi:hypothetical protein